MKIIIELSSWLKRYIPEQQVEVYINEKATVADVIKAAGIPLEEVGFIVRNNEKILDSLILSEDDRIKLYPYIIGG